MICAISKMFVSHPSSALFGPSYRPSAPGLTPIFFLNLSLNLRPSRFRELVVFRFCGTRSPSISARSHLVFCSLGARFRVCTVPLRLFGFDSIFLVPLFDYMQVLFAPLSSASTPLHLFPILVYFFSCIFC